MLTRYLVPSSLIALGGEGGIGGFTSGSRGERGPRFPQKKIIGKMIEGEILREN